jgi:hypothetical protein
MGADKREARRETASGETAGWMTKPVKSNKPASRGVVDAIVGLGVVGEGVENAAPNRCSAGSQIGVGGGVHLSP